MSSSGFCGFFAGDRELRRFVFCSSNKADARCKEKNPKNTVSEDLTDMVTAASSIYEINSGNDQTNDP